MENPWHLYAMAVLYIIAGLAHFIFPKMYLRIMPRYLPHHKFLVLLSGAAEMVLGLGLCFQVSRNLSAYGIIAMLTVFLTVHFYMLSSKKAAAGIPKWILVLRIPLQFILMYWAYGYILP
ncbi:hypothetical protein EZV76_14220 [Flagellimonas alvinocaridis]|uniref:DoxX family protein n=1 Tax=Flagellimonas alvinocaridis TaxID=2530200 RepID=A0A4S8RHC8_9FLAO|nr:hypothetical protein [Allomuricauda alvinocaridis]THV57747.1 hypothetical protein EZV76_14220 [Allomuricauda alvinocaridis]